MFSLLVIKTPNCMPICSRECFYERGSIFIISKKEWNNIKSYLSTIDQFNDSAEAR